MEQVVAVALTVSEEEEAEDINRRNYWPISVQSDPSPRLFDRLG
jgi:hypothetical protein